MKISQHKEYCGQCGQPVFPMIKNYGIMTTYFMVQIKICPLCRGILEWTFRTIHLHTELDDYDEYMELEQCSVAQR